MLRGLLFTLSFARRQSSSTGLARAGPSASQVAALDLHVYMLSERSQLCTQLRLRLHRLPISLVSVHRLCSQAPVLKGGT